MSGPAPQRGVVVEVPHGEHVAQAAGQARAAAGEEAAYLVLDRGAGVEVAERAATASSRRPSSSARSAGVVEVAGRQVLVGHAGERRRARCARRARARSAG